MPAVLSFKIKYCLPTIHQSKSSQLRYFKSHVHFLRIWGLKKAFEQKGVKMVPFLEEICMSNKKKMKRVKLAAVSITKRGSSVSHWLTDSQNSSSFPSSFQIKVSPFFALLLHLRFSFLLVFFSCHQWQKGRSKTGLQKHLMCECDLGYNYHFSSLSTSTNPNPPFHSFNFTSSTSMANCLASLKTLH